MSEDTVLCLSHSEVDDALVESQYLTKHPRLAVSAA